MDRAQFMKQLERLLSDISEAEKQEALAYYNSYFDEAGPENEASVIRELGSPGKVAAIIKADLDESNEEYAQYTENGYELSLIHIFLQELHTYPAHIPLAPPEYGKRGSWHLVPEDNKVRPDKEHTGMVLHPHCKNNHSKPMGFFSLQRAQRCV